MSAAAPAPPPPAPPAAPPPAAPLREADLRALPERQMAVLDRLVEIGMEVAEAAGRAAREGAEGGADPALSYSRAARAVRLTLALQTRLAEGLLARRREDAHLRRVRIRAELGRALEAERPDSPENDGDDTDALAVRESLSDVEDDDILALPLAEAVARVCRHLGLDPLPFVEPFAEPGAAPEPPRPPPLPSAPPTPSSPPPHRHPRACPEDPAIRRNAAGYPDAPAKLRPGSSAQGRG